MEVQWSALWRGNHMWQSHVEIEGYSIAYFDRIAVFEVPYRWTSIKGRAHTRFIDVWISNEYTKRVWAPPLTEVQQYGASNVVSCPDCIRRVSVRKIVWALDHFERSDAIKIRDGITFDFYTGLPLYSLPRYDMAVVTLLCVYRIAGNFWGRKLSRNAHLCRAKKAPPQILQRKLSRIARNSRQFSPSKVSSHI